MADLPGNWFLTALIAHPEPGGEEGSTYYCKRQSTEDREEPDQPPSLGVCEGKHCSYFGET